MDPAVGVGGEEQYADAVRILSSYLDHAGGTLTNDVANEGMLIQCKF